LKINKLCLLSENNSPDCFLSAGAFRRKIVFQTIFPAAVLRYFRLWRLLPDSFSKFLQNSSGCIRYLSFLYLGCGYAGDFVPVVSVTEQ